MSEEKKNPELCKQCDEYLAGWKRALADYDNLKKDLARERAQMHTHATERAAHGFLLVLDHFDAAVKFVPDGMEPKMKQWVSGILHVRKELEDVLKELGLKPFGESGDPFDPNLHEASSERWEDGKKDQTILDVVSRGWKIGETVIRSAKVVINKQN